MVRPPERWLRRLIVLKRGQFGLYWPSGAGNKNRCLNNY
jgi:hypothetical protein